MCVSVGILVNFCPVSETHCVADTPCLNRTYDIQLGQADLNESNDQWSNAFCEELNYACNCHKLWSPYPTIAGSIT